VAADPGSRPALRAFARAEAPARTLCREHRHQTTEVGRCLDVLAALTSATEGDPRPLALTDLGTGAGLGLHLDGTCRTAVLGRTHPSAAWPEWAPPPG
jgi:hypothetical protein